MCAYGEICTEQLRLFVSFSCLFSGRLFMEYGFELFKDVGRALKKVGNLLQNILGFCYAGVEHFNSAVLVNNQKADRRDAETGSATATKIFVCILDGFSGFSVEVQSTGCKSHRDLGNGDDGCTAFGIDAAAPAGDVSAWKSADALYLQANTEKGTALLNSLSGLLLECTDDAVNAEKEKISKIMDKLPLKDLTTDAFGGGKTMELFNDPAWDELSSSCLGCGTCTFVCPTCQCYDIKDFNTGNGVIRYRCWDSCMYSEFTKMAHGNNRLTQKERFRQRFMHKLVYYPENNDGLFSCVGCGRRLAKCPISMNIVKVMKKIGGNKGE